ncbi:hypothetical protein AVEN_206101-1, partial [Araneus ventricosus]
MRPVGGGPNWRNQGGERVLSSKGENPPCGEGRMWVGISLVEGGVGVIEEASSALWSI